MGNSDDAKYDQELDLIAMPGLDFGESEFEWEVSTHKHPLMHEFL